MSKVVILAGGRGTRLAEETSLRPKPMVEIGGVPILAHILATYAHFGHQDFLIACGYMGDYIANYFSQWQAGKLHNQDCAPYIRSMQNQWSVGCIDTGLDSLTGGRVLRLREYLQDDRFMVTYGDGVCNVDIDRLLAFHKSHGRLATVTAVRPPARWGALVMEGQQVRAFTEKCSGMENWINGGYFVFEPEVLDYITDDSTILERGPLEALAQQGELMAYKHDGFWQPMDTIHERDLLRKAWDTESAEWATSAHEFEKWAIQAYGISTSRKQAA
ncbi:glucose-1-phosphate cytidylyltransferase [Blastopirellula marina]|uniref:Glucose-1-phosphate cytidylyltransferase n=1 Tax=Blastopirellula marina DSM 3645 TaxID=314230 RepID=A3ZSX8_9BACT|nr:glucose-1-phosphate cytidylyltransferase [Blastopirellula marina]EAQ80404.1 glucose-1-phosphate cytidylyltransferase [Blastopirellula marina DSM 3645]